MIRITAETTEIAPGLQALTIKAGDWTAKLGAPSDVATELAARIDAGELQEEVAPAVAAHVLWTYGATGGVEPSHFIGNLLDAIGKADRADQLRLAAVYPAYVQAMYAASRGPDGIRSLQDIAKRLVITTGGEN